MDWIKEAKRIFYTEKPTHFTDYHHCSECLEHDQTLINSSIDKISMEELGKPSWDPICFCSNDGKKYYMPALIRLSLETINNDFYLDQFLFHMSGNGKDNDFFISCSDEQRKFISNFIEYIIHGYPSQLEKNMCTNEALAALDIWADEDFNAN